MDTAPLTARGEGLRPAVRWRAASEASGHPSACTKGRGKTRRDRVRSDRRVFPYFPLVAYPQTR